MLFINSIRLSFRILNRVGFCSFLTVFIFIFATCSSGFSGDTGLGSFTVSENMFRSFYLQPSDSLLLQNDGLKREKPPLSDSLRNMAGDSLLYYGRKMESDSVHIDSARVDSAAIRQVRIRSPKGAMWRSLLFPGWGQLYNGRYIKSIIIGGTEAAFIYGIYIQEKRRQEAKDMGYEDGEKFYLKDRKKFTWWLTGTLIYSALDAYIDAQLMNFDVSEDLSAGVSGGLLFIRINF